MRDAVTAHRTLAFCTECSAVHARPRDDKAAERTRAERPGARRVQHRVRFALIAKCTRPVDLSHRLNGGAALHAVACAEGCAP